MAEMVDRPGSGHRAGGAGDRPRGQRHGLGVLRRPARVLDELRARPQRVPVVFLDAPDDVLVRRFEGTRRAPPAWRRQGGGVHRRRAAAAGAGARAGRPRRRHRRAQLNQLRGADPRGLFGDDSRRRACGPRWSPSATSTACPLDVGPGLRLPVPAQPVLGRGAAPLVGARRTGAGLRVGPRGRPTRFWDGSTSWWGRCARILSLSSPT